MVLRPEPGATATVEKARERGLEATAVPLFEGEALRWKAPDTASFDGLLLTSANAVRHGGDQLRELRGLPAYAVGQATGSAAREAGFDIAATGDAGVDRLLGSIDSDLRLLHLCGEDRRQPEHASQQITALPVYRMRALEGLDAAALRGAVVLVHSPRAAARLAELVRKRDAIALVAISAEAAAAAGDGWEAVHIADTPSDEAMLALAARLCNKPSPL